MPRWWSALAAIVVGAIVFRGALGYFFAQDDFAGLARAAGVLPRLSGPWRYLSGQTYFDLMRGLAGLDPLPYRIVNLLAHGGCAAVLATLLARRFAAPAALLGAVFFAAHPALFTALYSISGIGEILAVGFALLTVLAAASRASWRWLAVPLYALSLLSKESTLLLPVGLLVLIPLLRGREAATARTARAPGGIGDPLPWVLAAISALYLAYFAFGDVFATRSLPVSAPYALDWVSSPPLNALSYLGWTVNFWVPTVQGFSDAVDRRVFAWGAAAVILWLVGAFMPPLRRRGWISGGLLYLLLLAPVLPLRNHTYHYYLYAPLVGAAWCVAALADGLVGRLTRAAAWTVALVLAAVLVVNGGLLVHKIETYPFVFPEMRADATVDRARIARNVVEGLREADIPSGARVWFWSPAVGDRALDPRAVYWENNLRSALMDGLALRVLVPQVAEVRFVRDFEPARPTDRYAVYARDGRLRVLASAELDSLLRVHPLGR